METAPHFGGQKPSPVLEDMVAEKIKALPTTKVSEKSKPFVPGKINIFIDNGGKRNLSNLTMFCTLYLCYSSRVYSIFEILQSAVTFQGSFQNTIVTIHNRSIKL